MLWQEAFGPLVLILVMHHQGYNKSPVSLPFSKGENFEGSPSVKSLSILSPELVEGSNYRRVEGRRRDSGWFKFQFRRNI
jgi:hypothetical protein